MRDRFGSERLGASIRIKKTDANGQYPLVADEMTNVAEGNRCKSLFRGMQIMFAKPHWFRTKSIGSGVTPACWRGWLYVAGAVAIALLPTLLLLGRRQGLEGLIWLSVVGGFLAYEFWQVRRSLLGYCTTKPVASTDTAMAALTPGAPQAGDDGIYFLDQQNAGPVNTARFQFSLKQ